MWLAFEVEVGVEVGEGGSWVRRGRKDVGGVAKVKDNAPRCWLEVKEI